uniref:Uncharacterized protein n=1 Tax=Sphaerodactylus townsendi TaxID=933632 RepID=A0ACB8FWW2_9SAUR
MGPVCARCVRRPPALLALLALPLLLPWFLTWGASSAWKGETCRRWVEGDTVPADTFLCPEESDGAGAFFCCGTCARSYCCASLGERLDQRPCFREDRQGAPQPSPDVAAASEWPGELMYAVLPLVLIVIMGTGIFALAYCNAFRHCRRFCKRREPPPPVVPIAALFSVERPPRPAHPDVSLPHPSRGMFVLPYSEEDAPSDSSAPPPYPGYPVVKFHRPGLLEDGAASLSSQSTLPDKTVLRSALESQQDSP